MDNFYKIHLKDKAKTVDICLAKVTGEQAAKDTLDSYANSLDLRRDPEFSFDATLNQVVNTYHFLDYKGNGWTLSITKPYGDPTTIQWESDSNG